MHGTELVTMMKKKTECGEEMQEQRLTLRERRKRECRERKKKKACYWLIIVILCLIVAACIGYLLHYRWTLRQNELAYEQLRATEEQEAADRIVTATEESEQEEKIYCEQIYDFNELHEQNEDIYAWITVPGTQVDYPVVQSETDNYYLDHNLDDSTGYPGCIYTNQCNAKDFSDYISVLYGHNMKNGTMFGSIHSFEDEEVFDEYDRIYIYTEERRLTYEIYAAVKFTDVYIPTYYDVKASDGRDSFLAALAEESENSEVSHISENIEILPEDKLITLSTCVNGEQSKRYLLVGVLIEEAYYNAE